MSVTGNKEQWVCQYGGQEEEQRSGVPIHHRGNTQVSKLGKYNKAGLFVGLRTNRKCYIVGNLIQLNEGTYHLTEPHPST